ncbi:MAG: hypothetical protein LBK99_01325, partial [Opitutaceae bacterium]|nr:hypothetical protein [Opitutaceae bacterium]
MRSSAKFAAFSVIILSIPTASFNKTTDHRAMRHTHSMTTTGIAAAASGNAAFAATSATEDASVIHAGGAFIYSGQKK